ncbi:MAG TPA: putative baseplate assembly protein [Chloroflexia bacterium]|jgi:hypothetical protein
MTPAPDVNDTCGCCEGIEIVTPIAIANRPGLDKLTYRVGTHASFLETMKARLTTTYIETERPTDQAGDGQPEGAKMPCPDGTVPANRTYPLAGLATRESNDPAIAMLDAWATVADVLTFYQERIANEGYLRTATERRSVLELARLIGYALRPGVASSVYLAYELDKDAEVTLPRESRVQSVPGPNEQMQSFETSDDLHMRAAWNKIRPRLTRPQSIDDNPESVTAIYFQGTATNLKPNDPLLIVTGSEGGKEERTFRRVASINVQTAEDRTRVTLQPSDFRAGLLQNIAARFQHLEDFGIAEDNPAVSKVVSHLEGILEGGLDGPTDVGELLESIAGTQASIVAGNPADAPVQAWLDGLSQHLSMLTSNLGPAGTVGTQPEKIANPDALLESLQKPPSIPPAGSARLGRDITTAFAQGSDTLSQLKVAGRSDLGSDYYTAWANARVSEPSKVRVYAFRVAASLFGHNAPKEPKITKEEIKPQSEWPEWRLAAEENNRTLFLDAAYDQVLPGSYIAVQTARDTDSTGRGAEPVSPAVLGIRDVVTYSRNAYGVSGKTTRLTLRDGTWTDTKFDVEPGSTGEGENPKNTRAEIGIIRRTIVYAQSEELMLAEEPITEPVCHSRIALDGLYDGLESGRWLIISGERDDIPASSNIRASELVMLAALEQGFSSKLPGDKTHSTLVLASPLSYCYKRESVEIYANVVKATHGETRNEVLGNGDGSRAMQTFALHQSPLTYLPAPTPAGAASTLEVRVNEVKWHEVDNLIWLQPYEHGFVTRTGDAGKTSVVFGDGKRGGRPPTGMANVRAKYRTGIGRPGNVRAGQISLLATRPLGVKGVTNPLPATGGADREGLDQARRNAPLAVMALDRLVSVRDYEDFARTYAGIGKASARRLTDGRRQLVHLTIAGAGDIPISPTDDLYRNLRQALHDAGDPYQPVVVEVRELLRLIISGKVRLHPDYKWEFVEPKIRAALLDRFSFERRDLGQDVVLSEVISTIQSVPGVAYVDVDALEATTAGSEEELKELSQRLAEAGQNPPNSRIVTDFARYGADGKIEPAQLAFLLPEVPDTLILKEITS